MAAVTETIPNLINGVSQQAPSIRLSTQAERQLNGTSSVAEGLGKRMPTEHISKIMDALAGDYMFHTIARSGSEKYMAAFGSDVRVFDFDGVEQTVTVTASGAQYLSGNTGSYKAITLKDYTLMIDSSREVDTGPWTTSAATAYQAILFVEGVNYGVEYVIKANGVDVASHTTGDAGVVANVKTTDVATDLYNQLILNQLAGSYVGTTFTLYENMILINTFGVAPIDWSFTDSFGNTYATLVGPEMGSITDLPEEAYGGFEVKLTDAADQGGANIYLIYERNDSSTSFGPGKWVEVDEFGQRRQLAGHTMPHALIRASNGTFTFDVVDWAERKVGDDDVSTFPSFVGRTINDAYLDRNRLCFVHSDGVCMSRSRYPFDFFRKTATTVVDDDPIDVSASGGSVANLQTAAVNNNVVLLFGSLRQYTIDVDYLIASEPPAIMPVASYATDGGASPVVGGRYVYFTSSDGENANVHELVMTGDQTRQVDAKSITKHVPKYLPAGVSLMEITTTADTMIVLTEGDKTRMYVYRFHWRGADKLQSSWSEWEISQGGEIEYVTIVQDTVFMAVRYADGIYLEKLGLAQGRSDDGVDFVFRLDRRLTEADCTKTLVDGNTVITYPYVPSAPEDMRVVSRGTGTRAAGVEALVVSRAGSLITVSGDWTTEDFFAGSKYSFEYEFSQPTLKKQSSSGAQASIIGGRIQVDTWNVAYSNTGYFRVVVEAPGKQAYTYVNSGTKLGLESSVLGQPRISDGQFKFRVKARAENVKITLINDSFTPCYFTAAEWEGRYKRRNR